MIRIAFLILAFYTFCPGVSFSKECCTDHLGVSNCYDGKIICGDGKKTRCRCGNSVLYKEVVDKEGKKKRSKFKKVKNIFKRKEKEENINMSLWYYKPEN